ncbi:MAG: exodeoxyribonuclease VII large subunit [Aerococcus sp.]|nr:exodeoxyribonuclease VII large subunit [Aerococcus sp.]
MASENYLTVTQLTHYLKAKFDHDPYLNRVYLTGEVSGYRSRGKNNHQYFSIKDEHALISAIMYRRQFHQLNFELEEGMKVLVIGRVSLYEPSGRYQVIIDSIQPDGVGAFYVAYEQLKAKLAKEGLFDFPHKPIPLFPKKIAVVTSPSGAVIRDIMTTTRRRYPIVQLVLYPTVVQGDKAAASIIHNLKRIEADGSYDTVIVGRGGGSIEDLWCFNDEQLARTVSAMTTPVITSVGHETDTTLIDYVADQRAATPTAAAEIATPVLQEVLLQVKDYQQRLYHGERQQLLVKQRALKQLKQSYVFTQPERLYDGYRLRLSEWENRLQQVATRPMHEKQRHLNQLIQQLRAENPKSTIVQRQGEVKLLYQRLKQEQQTYMTREHYQLDHLVSALDLLSPLKRLSKGYTYATVNQQPLRSIKDVSAGDKLELTLADGQIDTTVQAINAQTLMKSSDTSQEGG